MQGRAAVVYVAFFLVIAAAAFGFAATAESPSVSIEAEIEFQEGDEFEIDGVTYTVDAVTEEDDGPGTIELTWVNQEGTISEAWAVGENVTVDNQEYTVEVTDDEPPAVELVRPEDTLQFEQGDTLTYQGNETTVDTVTQDEVTVSWTGPMTEEIPMTEGVATEIGGVEYVAHFPGDGAVQLTSDVATYNDEVDDVNTAEERIDATWVIGILSSLGGLLLLAMTYLPRKEL